ncbi:carboxyl transferase domain-containing protein [uncultured Albimonas sp.]|uniref:acetyl-CoA carboxylase family protein n=1 Tax=uncultured Albimonas sp. TaxID=1331701 RepID=UPI0030EC1AAF
MTIRRLLIANRGEIAVRIARTAAEMRIETVAVFPEDDAKTLHVRACDHAEPIPGRGARAYLDPDALVEAAKRAGADAVHPGYGFLSESVAFARACEHAGLTWVGPTPASLALFGDKVEARAHAARHDVPTIPGSPGPVDAAGAEAVFDQLPEGASLVIKAVAGGGGRGMRVVHAREEIAEAHARCTSEAKAAFGDGAVYAERFLPAARHIEVQVLGDGTGECLHLLERDCTLQRRHQKVLEIAPAPDLSAPAREALLSHALKLARAGDYRSLGTFEFLALPDASEVFFIEANPRIQVEHTVTEEILGLDLVRLQLQIASGRTLADLGLSQASLPQPSGYAIQARVNAERMDAKGQARPSVGTLSKWEPPFGPGVRIDTLAYSGWGNSPAYDSLIAKVIVHSRSPEFGDALRKIDRALGELKCVGIETNARWLRALSQRPEVADYAVTTRFIESVAGELAAAAAALPDPAAEEAGAEVAAAAVAEALPDGAIPLSAPTIGTVTRVPEAGARLRRGEVAVLMESMKMEHAVTSPVSGEVLKVLAAPGDTLDEGAPILALMPDAEQDETEDAAAAVDLDHIRADLQEVRDRLYAGQDESKPEKVAKRHGRGQRTARENLSSLADEGSFQEYGGLVIAAQAARRSEEDLVRNTTGDGVVTGIGTINADRFGTEKGRCAFTIYDYMVLAGTQGQRHHRKLDRIFSLAGECRMPMIVLAEGGGGRPGETERRSVAGLDGPSFARFAALSGKAPLVGVVSGRCFAGNAALLGCCDVIIADESSNIGMAGPAMIEGGGLGKFAPEEVGPIDVQSKNGVVDIRVKDEVEACAAAKKYISYFQGDEAEWTAPDQRLLRHAIPENRLRAHDVRHVIETMADDGSVLELRREFGLGIVTALVRIEGKPFGLMANDSRYLGGAIDAPAADKAARFLQICDTFGLPVISLVDTPGFMVGPEAEKTALVRHVSRMFVAAAGITVPIFAVVLRKGYGLGAMAMTGGAFHESLFTISWPTGEFGGMGLEGAVHLGFRKELEAKTDPREKQALFDELLAKMYASGKAIQAAITAELDAVIDPVETRQWILAGLRSVPAERLTGGKGRTYIDAW